MAFKVTAPKCLVCLTVWLLIFFYSSGSSLSQAAPFTKPASWPEFRKDHNGYSFRVQMRFQVTDIRVGEISVKELFEKTDHEEPSWRTGGHFKQITVRLIIKSDEHLKTLQARFAEQNTDNLTVLIEDSRRSSWDWIPGCGAEELYRMMVYIHIVTPCQMITNVVYSVISAKFESQREGQTDKPINLNELYDKLLHETIEPYLSNLEPLSQNNPCFESKTFKLLKWIRQEEASGFGSGEYSLSEGLKGLLEPVIKAMREVYPEWSQYNLQVNITGYTDKEEVGKSEDKELKIDKTGIDAAVWSRMNIPLQIYYGRCEVDTLAKDGKKEYINFMTGRGMQIPGTIKNNCQLGAARAYVTLVYLLNELGRTGVEDSYATGGVDPKLYKNSTIDDQRNRKIDIEFTVKAGKIEK